MRPECAWSMSTVGLTAQEISFPIESPFHWGSYCHSMAGYKPRSHLYELDNGYFSMSTSHKDHSYQVQQKGPQHTFERQKYSSSSQRLPQKKSRPTLIPPSYTSDAHISRSVDKDQVIPPLLKLSIHECSSRCSKHPSSESPEAETSPMDSDIEYFQDSDDNCCLVANQCSKPSSFRYGVWNRRSFKNCGQINHAYYHGPIQSSRQPVTHSQMTVLPEVEKRCEQQQQQQKEPPEPVICPKQQDKVQRKLRRSHSGPAGSLNKPSLPGLGYHKQHNNSEETDLPPPLPPRASQKTDCFRRWSGEVSSAAYSDEDKPPKVPPRDPLSRGSSRTPSPKSLPMYVNGIMPPTQSFAPNPNYVSSRSLPRQNSEPSACIHPIIENGVKVSNTHYYLLPARSPTDSTCDDHNRRKAPVDLV